MCVNALPRVDVRMQCVHLDMILDCQTRVYAPECECAFVFFLRSAISHAKYNKRSAHWKSNDLVPLSRFSSIFTMETQALLTNRIINVYCFVWDYIIQFSFRFFPFMLTFFHYLCIRLRMCVCIFFVLSLSVQANQKRVEKNDSRARKWESWVALFT